MISTDGWKNFKFIKVYGKFKGNFHYQQCYLQKMQIAVIMCKQKVNKRKNLHIISLAHLSFIGKKPFYLA